MCHSILAPWAAFADVGLDPAGVVWDEPQQGNHSWGSRGQEGQLPFLAGLWQCHGGCDGDMVAVMVTRWLSQCHNHCGDTMVTVAVLW